ncbi:MAG: hypothetical protein SFU99_24055, partial [Saprospiraceae bacterium]|nr:hypothetical protein [Saprospiraceae bacterium]
VVPYDFDFSGLVNASYASTDATLGIKTVRERKFLGMAQSPEELKSTIEHFQAHKKEIFDYVRKFKLLSMESRTDIIQFLESFYHCLDEGLDLQTPGKC